MEQPVMVSPLKIRFSIRAYIFNTAIFMMVFPLSFSYHSVDHTVRLRKKCSNTRHSFQSDIDECSTHTPCDRSANCTNIAGSFECTCKTGFTGDGIINCEGMYKYVVANEYIVFHFFLEDAIGHI